MMDCFLQNMINLKHINLAPSANITNESLKYIQIKSVTYLIMNGFVRSQKLNRIKNNINKKINKCNRYV